MAIRILLADDHALVRAGLNSLISGFSGCEIVGEAADGDEAVRLASALSPDVMLLDISMPKLNGLDACRRIARGRPGGNVILLSMHAAEDFVLRGFAAGAKGYMTKDSAPSELERALRTVARGGTFLCAGFHHIADAAVEQLRRGASAPRAQDLSARQRQVLQLIAQGNSTRAIADRLCLSVKTVETHRAQLMKKIGIRDVAGLTRYAMRTGLIPPER